MTNFHILEWPFLGLIILLQLLHVIINIWYRCLRCKKLRETQENPQRCNVRVTTTPRSSTQHQNSIMNVNSAPSTSRDPNFVPKDEYAVVNSSMKKKNRVFGIEPVTDVKVNVHQEDRIYCNFASESEYQNSNKLLEGSEYQSTWDGASTAPVSKTDTSKKSPFIHIRKK